MIGVALCRAGNSFSLNVTFLRKMALLVERLYSLKVSLECNGDTPRYMHFCVLGLNFFRWSCSTYVSASQPNILRWATLGLLPVASSHGVARPGRAVMSCICTDCATASPQNCSTSRPEMASRVLALETIMSMYFSTGLKFGEYGGEAFCFIPFSRQNLAKSPFRYSLALSWMIVSGCPHVWQ